MDERATYSLTGTLAAHPAVSSEAQADGERAAIDGAGAHREADLAKVLRAIAARIDVVLDEKVAAGAEPAGRHRAAQAWSSVVGKRATDATPDLRRHALATTVLRISADGLVDDRTRDVGEDNFEAHAESEHAPDRQSDADRSDVQLAGAVTPSDVEVAPARHMVAGSPAPAATDRSDVENRLRAVRERLATRHASVTTARTPPTGPRAGLGRAARWRRVEIRTLIQRLLIGLAIVGASAIVSILIT